MKNTFLIILILPFFSCSHNRKSNEKFDNIKYFVSLDSFIKLQERFVNNYSIGIAPEICFDTLFALNQVDTLKSKICRSDLFSFGFIPLKYRYGKKYYFLSTFPFSCNGSFPDYYLEKINVKFENNNFLFDVSGEEIFIMEKRLKDSLINKFSANFKAYFEKVNKITSMNNDTLKTKKLLSLVQNKYGYVIILSIKEDNQLQQLKTSIDLVLNTYEVALSDCLRTYYKKNLCELSQFELFQFSKNLFLRFEINNRVD